MTPAQDKLRKRRAKAKRLKIRQSPKRLKAKADRLFSIAVRSVGLCESGRIEHKGPLQCAHGFSRRYLATRWTRENAFCLCAGCHVFYTHRPLEWDNWLRDRLGVRYWDVRAGALGGDVDISETLARLKAAA